MKGQSTDGTSSPLTVTEASSVVEGLLSDPEEKQSHETPRVPTEPQPKESEETEQADPEEQSEEGEEQEEEQTPQPKTYRVKVNGEEVEVTEDELLNGYSRNADYTRKTQQVAEERKKLEAEAAEVSAERQKYATHLTQLSEALRAVTPAEPDWDALREQDPAEFAATWAQWQQHKERMQAVEAERQRAAEAVANDQRKKFVEQLESEKTKLVEAIPAWKDDAVAKKETVELREFAKAAGYTDEEIASVYDHRVLVLLRKAMLHDKAQKEKPAVQQRIQQVKAATPGPANSAARKPMSEATKAHLRLVKTGRVDDAAAAIEKMLD